MEEAVIRWFRSQTRCTTVYRRTSLRDKVTDAVPVNVTDPRALEHTLKDLAPGTVIRVSIVPMNDSGAGPTSATVELTV
jgi:hypothetical protein